MGADFLCAWLPHCRQIDDDRRHELQRIIEGLTKTDLMYYEFEDGDLDPQVETWKCKLTDAIDFYCDSLGGRHDISSDWVVGGGYPVDISGGMSHGDAPTDSCEWMWKISNCLPLFNKLEEWAKADHAAVQGQGESSAYDDLLAVAREAVKEILFKEQIAGGKGHLENLYSMAAAALAKVDAASQPKPELTVEQQREADYLASGGSKCPVCNSANISSCGDAQFDADWCAMTIECLDCRAEWDDVHTLSGICNVTLPK